MRDYEHFAKAEELLGQIGERERMALELIDKGSVEIAGQVMAPAGLIARIAQVHATLALAATHAQKSMWDESSSLDYHAWTKAFDNQPYEQKEDTNA